MIGSFVLRVLSFNRRRKTTFDEGLLQRLSLGIREIVN